MLEQPEHHVLLMELNMKNRASSSRKPAMVWMLASPSNLYVEIFCAQCDGIKRWGFRENYFFCSSQLPSERGSTFSISWMRELAKVTQWVNDQARIQTQIDFRVWSLTSETKYFPENDPSLPTLASHYTWNSILLQLALSVPSPQEIH